MSEATVTARQLETLRLLAQPDAHATYMRYMGRFNPTAYWYIWGANPRRHTKQIEALIEKGLIDRVADGAYGDAHAVINAAGKRFLKSQVPA